MSKGSIAVLLAMAGLACYRPKPLPEVKHVDLAKKRQCADDGRRFIRERKLVGVVGEPEFAYNAERNTCLCAFRVVLGLGDGIVSDERYVYDVLTNREIVVYSSTRSRVGTTQELRVDGVPSPPASEMQFEMYRGDLMQ